MQLNSLLKQFVFFAVYTCTGLTMLFDMLVQADYHQ